MTKEKNGHQDIAIAKVQQDCVWIKEQLTCITKAVFNDLPHKIDDMRVERESEINKIREEIAGITNKIVYGVLVMIAASLILQIILKYY